MLRVTDAAVLGLATALLAIVLATTVRVHRSPREATFGARVMAYRVVTLH